MREEGASSRKANPKFPPRNFGPGSCSSPGGGHGSGHDAPPGSFRPSRVRFGRSGSNPGRQGPSRSSFPGKGMDPKPAPRAQGPSSGAVGSRSQDFSWMRFLVWLRSFSPSLPSLALLPAPMDAWNKGSLCCFPWKIGKTTGGEIPLLRGLGARYPSHPGGIGSSAGV